MTAKKERLLVVEDEPTSRALLAAYLKEMGYQVVTAENAAETRVIMKKEAVDLLLLDIRLPDEDGITLAQDLQAEYDTPIVFVTILNNDDDKIQGLKLGASDYITKPYNPEELYYRVKNVLARANGSGDQSGDDQIFSFSGYVLDIGRHILTLPNGKQPDLTSGEFTLLKELVLAQGRVKTRDQLLQAINPLEEPESTDRTVDVLVSRLRAKLKEYGGDPGIILTVKGYGYRLDISK